MPPTNASGTRDREHCDDAAAIGGEFDLSAPAEQHFAGSALVEIDGVLDAAVTAIDPALSLPPYPAVNWMRGVS